MSERVVGQPTLSDDLIKTVASLITMGVPPLSAAASLEIAASIHKEWMADGEANERGKYRQRRYYVAVCKAVATCEAQLVSKIRTAANENWQAAAWLAERRYPETYIRRSVNVQEGAGSNPNVVSDPFADLDTNVTPIRKARRTKE